MSNQNKKLKKLASDNELEVIEYPDGRVLIVGGMVNIHWWPNSKRRTVYAEGAPSGHSYATEKQVINLALNGVLR